MALYGIRTRAPRRRATATCTFCNGRVRTAAPGMRGHASRARRAVICMFYSGRAIMAAISTWYVCVRVCVV